MAGSGKTTAIRALEDLGFFCIDNLPVVLLDKVLELCERATIANVAVVIDAREASFLAHYTESMALIAKAGYAVETLFLTSDEETLVRRFKETRRRHPLQGEGTLQDGLQAERDALHVIEQTATEVIDTSGLTVHSLRRRVQEAFRESAQGPLTVRLESFGFKHGLSPDADFVFDVRFLPNPFFVPELKDLSGRDPPVASYVVNQEGTPELLELVTRLVTHVLPRVQFEGRAELKVAVGCTGGRHRSVAIVEWLASRLLSEPYRIVIQHRDLDKA